MSKMKWLALPIVIMALVSGLMLGDISSADLTYKCGEAYVDFYNIVSSSTDPWIGYARNSGTAALASGETGHPGIVTLKSASATASSGFAYMNSNTQWISVLLSGGERMEFVFRIQNSSTNFTARMGFWDSDTEALPVDGAYFNISGVTIWGDTVTNSVWNTTATNYSISTNTWYRGIITLTAGAAQAKFYLYDMSYALLWSGTLGNVPSVAGRETGHGVIAFMKVAMAPATSLLDLDFMYVYVPCIPTPSPSPSAISPIEPCIYKNFTQYNQSSLVYTGNTVGFWWNYSTVEEYLGITLRVKKVENTGYSAGNLSLILAMIDLDCCSYWAHAILQTASLSNTSFINNSFQEVYFKLNNSICLYPCTHPLEPLWPCTYALMASASNGSPNAYYEISYDTKIPPRGDLGKFTSNSNGTFSTCQPNESLYFKLWVDCVNNCPPTPTPTASPITTSTPTATPEGKCAYSLFTGNTSEWFLENGSSRAGFVFEVPGSVILTEFNITLKNYDTEVPHCEGLNVSICSVNLTDLTYSSLEWNHFYPNSTFNQGDIEYDYNLDIDPDVELQKGYYCFLLDVWGGSYYSLFSADMDHLINDEGVLLSGDDGSSWYLFPLTHFAHGIWIDCPKCPSRFIALSLGAHSANLNWSKEPYTTNFTVRARIDYYPTSYSDGELIYWGTNNSTIVTGLALDMSTYYFRIWAENHGNYSTCYDSASVGGETMVYLVYGIVCLGLMGLAFWRRLSWVFITSALAWAGFATTTLWTSDKGSPAWMFGWVGIILAVGMFLAVLYMTRNSRRTGREAKEEAKEKARVARERSDEEELDKIYKEGRRSREHE